MQASVIAGLLAGLFASARERYLGVWNQPGLFFPTLVDKSQQMSVQPE